MATPLKLKDANGNIQELTTTEENYIAYQVGLHLSTADSAEVGSLNRATTGDTVGTHPSTSITTGTTNTVIYQTNGTAAETDANVFRPIMWVDSASETGMKMMPDIDLNEAVDRYLSKIFTNEYPGSYRLSTSAPSGDWTEQQTAFIDTRTDGASIAHKLWKRTGGTAPTAVKPMRLKNEASFAGIQEMSDAEIKFSFGQRAKTRIAASKIGSYQLRNSSQGAPTDTGTWVAKGTATDTKNTTADANFTRDSTVNFQSSYTASATVAYTTNYTSITDLAYISVSTAQFSVDYSRDFGGTFAATYTGSYEGGYVTTYARNFAANYVSNYASTQDVGYLTQYTRNFTGNFTNTFASGYQRNFTGNFTGAGPTIAYTRNVDAGYEAIRHDYYAGPGGNYERQTQFGMYVRETFNTYLRTVIEYYVGPSVYVGPSIQYSGPVIYSGPSPDPNYQTTAFTPFQAYVSNVVNPVAQYTAGYYLGESRFGPNYIGPAVGGYFYQGSGRTAAYLRATVPEQNFIVNPGNPQVDESGGTFSGTYTSPQTTGGVSYAKVISQIQYLAYRQVVYDVYTRAFASNFSGAGPTVAYTRNVDPTYTRNFTGNFTNTFANQFSATYTTTYTGDYQKEFANSYVRDFSATYSRNFEGSGYVTQYESIYTGEYTTQYTLDYEGNYVNTYEGNYATEYSKDFETSYITDYLGNFTGNFAGETIQSANETNETYTLYVRIS